MIHEIIVHPDPVLEQRCEDAVAGPETSQLLLDMGETMLYYRGAGLAAPQIGKLVRAVVFRDFAADTIISILNPVIVKRSKIRTWSDEGCLSLPGVTKRVRRVRRAWSVDVDAIAPDGSKVQLHATDFEAFVLQHELEHLDGITIATARAA